MPATRLTEGELETTAILPGGDPFSPTIKVTPAVLSAATFLGEMELDPAAVPDGIEGRKLQARLQPFDDFAHSFLMISNRH